MKSFTLTRRIAARPSIVYDALTTADGVASWWGPDDLPVIRAEMDARAGGSFRVRFRTVDGLEHEACGEFLELVPPQRVVMTWRWASGGVAEESGRTSRIAIDLTPIARGTELTFTHGDLASEVSMKSHEGGWTGAFVKLVRRLGSAIVVAACLGWLGTACAPAAPRAEPATAQAATPSALAAAPAASYPSMASLEQYLEPSQADEVALARSAAPPAVSAEADVLVLGKRGYETAAKGKNGFVCLVERSWAQNLDSDELWNPKIRSPNCYNAAAVRSVLPAYLERTGWVLAGVPAGEMLARTGAALAAKEVPPPEVGSMCFMMSKSGYLNASAGHWHPHVMYFLPRADASAWGANVDGSPIVTPPANRLDRYTVFMSLVPRWSDGTSATAP
jgi:uncharacterized protein YndB with AHSA1/START domain